jgi:septal ring factor EnvC (AmiA/AmiB activator)
MNKSIFTVSAVLLASLTLPAAQGATKVVSAPAKETLQDVRSLAIASADEADALNAMINDAKVSPDSQAAKLMALRDDINHIGRDISRLEAEHGSLSDSEEQAVSRVVPLLRAAASDTSQAIAYFNNNKTHLWGSEDAAYAERIYKASEKVADTLKNCLKYEKLRDEESAIGSQLSTGMND